MVKLIEKDYVAVHDGEVCFLETNPSWGGEPYTAGLVKIEGMYGKGCTLFRVNWEGFGRHGSYRMSTYGKEWRLWTVEMWTPVCSVMNETRWK